MSQQGLGEFLNLVSEEEKLFQEFLGALQRERGSFGAVVALGARNGFQFTTGDVVEVARCRQSGGGSNDLPSRPLNGGRLSRPSRHMASLLIGV